MKFFFVQNWSETHIFREYEVVKHLNVMSGPSRNHGRSIRKTAPQPKLQGGSNLKPTTSKLRLGKGNVVVNNGLQRDFTCTGIGEKRQQARHSPPTLELADARVTAFNIESSHHSCL